LTFSNSRSKPQVFAPVPDHLQPTSLGGGGQEKTCFRSEDLWRAQPLNFAWEVMNLNDKIWIFLMRMYSHNFLVNFSNSERYFGVYSQSVRSFKKRKGGDTPPSLIEE